MRSIIPELTPDLLKHFKEPSKMAAAKPLLVSSFRQLVEYTAKLSFKNKDYLLFYRGQNTDYKNKAGSSSFYPTIYRGDYVLIREIMHRFDILDGASKALVDLFEQEKVEGFRELKRRKSIQWSILQHYEVCSTPLLDFTHSLRVACSFATLDNPNEFGFISVFGLPYLTNRISINSEHDLINVRLLSICPPTAFRPYFQEGYLVGTDDITSNFEDKTELDFSNRLIAKFKIPNSGTFWGNGFHQIPKESLYPDNDPILKLCQQIKYIADRELNSGILGEFLSRWTELEELLGSYARKEVSRFLTVRESTRLLFEKGHITDELVYNIERLRVFRNTLVHTPKKLSSGDVGDQLWFLNQVLDQIRRMLNM